MAHGVTTAIKRGASGLVCKTEGKAGIGSRRIFAPQFKLQVLDSYRNDVDCKGNQRATARKYGIHRRQIQKWLQVENNLRNSVIKTKSEVSPEARKCGFELALRNCDHRQLDDKTSEACMQRPVEAGELSTSRHAERDKRVPDSDACALYSDATLDRRVPEIITYNIPQKHELSPICSPQMYIPMTASPELSLYKCEYPNAVPLDFTVRRQDLSSPIDLSLKKSPRVEQSFTPVPLLPAPLPIQADHPPCCASPDSQIWDLSTKGTKRPHDDYSRHVSSSVDVAETKPVKLFKPYLLDDDNSSNSDNKCVENYQFDLSYSNNRVVESEYYYNNNNEYFYKDDAYKSYYYPSPEYYTNNVHFMDDKDNFFKKNSNFIKQRQSYSLDFKLSAIQCYYSDEICRGNQRAVATKYKIHRRQVQKWLKQEEELKQRIETTKHIAT